MSMMWKLSMLWKLIIFNVNDVEIEHAVEFDNFFNVNAVKIEHASTALTLKKLSN